MIVWVCRLCILCTTCVFVCNVCVCVCVCACFVPVLYRIHTHKTLTIRMRTHARQSQATNCATTHMQTRVKQQTTQHTQNTQCSRKLYWHKHTIHTYTLETYTQNFVTACVRTHTHTYVHTHTHTHTARNKPHALYNPRKN